MTPNLLRAQFFGIQSQKVTEGTAVKELISKSVDIINGEYRALQTLSAAVSKDPQANKAFQQALRDLADAVTDLRDVMQSRVIEGEEPAKDKEDKPKNEANLVKVMIDPDDKKTVDSMLSGKGIMHGFMTNTYGEVVMSFERSDLDDVETLLGSQKIYYREA